MAYYYKPKRIPKKVCIDCGRERKTFGSRCSDCKKAYQQALAEEKKHPRTKTKSLSIGETNFRNILERVFMFLIVIFFSFYMILLISREINLPIVILYLLLIIDFLLWFYLIFFKHLFFPKRYNPVMIEPNKKEKKGIEKQLKEKEKIEEKEKKEAFKQLEKKRKKFQKKQLSWAIASKNLEKNKE